MKSVRTTGVPPVSESTGETPVIRSAMPIHRIQHQPPVVHEGLKFFQGTHIAPDGATLEVDSISLIRNGQRWLPVMGEIHYSRVDPRDWRNALLKMRAGGIDIVASYVFWIHHEEREGEWNWTGSRHLRAFAQICAELKFPLVVRCGPWCHGEVRNGGLPDWILTKPFTPRTDDPHYLSYARKLYEQIAAQLRGLLFKDGGPVVGVQIENEFPGPAEHLLNLRNLAIECGLDVPLYTRTGWPSTTTPMPFGELLPLFGAYPDGFWDRTIKEMPGEFWRAFRFDRMRTDEQVGADMLGTESRLDPPDTPQYPYLTCEMGGGMEQSYHRRCLIDAMDIYAIVLAKLGSGSNLPGYYMYHGGTNPEGKYSTLQESQATKYWNDSPVKSYDFQAPIGQFGQLREHYHPLRILHHFTRDFGELLATMSLSLPATIPMSKEDTQSVRHAIRSDGRSGFLFVNNNQRLTEMPAKPQVQFEIALPKETVRFDPIDIPANSSFIWPSNLEVDGATLVWATAQLLARQNSGQGEIWYFFEIPGVRAKFAFMDGVREPESSREVAFTRGRISLVLLSYDDALRFRKDERGNVSFVDLRSETVVRTIVPELQKQHGELRRIQTGFGKVAEAPGDADFDAAAVWKIEIPSDIDLIAQHLLRVHYAGDVARFYANGQLITDNFYNGRPFDLSLRLLADHNKREVELRILPLQKNAPIYLDRRATPEFDDADAIARVDGVEIIRL